MKKRTTKDSGGYSKSSKSQKNSKNIYSSSSSEKKYIKKHSKNESKKDSVSLKSALKLVGKTIIILILIGVITMSLVITGLTVYVMKASETESSISLEKEDLMQNGVTIVYGQDDSGSQVELAKLSSGAVRIWVDITDVPDNVKNVFVAIEDKRFYEHEGVDFKRTFLAFLNMFLHFWDSEQGGSTITQQLVKNITNDRDNSPSRKIREIFRAMSLERTYSKDQILQAYLNIVPIGGANGNYEGIEAAAQLYFNKHIQDVTLAEAASIAAITNSPSYYEPIGHPENNKERRDLILWNMLDQGMITQTEYDQAINTPVTTNPGKVVGNTNGKEYQSYFVDYVLNRISYDLMEQDPNLTKEEADEQVKSCGYKIYTTIDIEMQNQLENLYAKPSTFGWNTFTNMPQSAFVVYDMNGNLKAMVGSTGVKAPGDRSQLNRAVSQRSPGSSIKPLTAYAPAIENNLVTYSSIVSDTPFMEKNPETGNPWPQNYDKKYHGDINLYYGLQWSYNTIPVKLIDQLGVENSYNFATQKVGLNLDESDKNYAPLATGSLTNGITINELTNAYQIFGNGGIYNSSICYTSVTDAAGRVILEPKQDIHNAISSDTSSVMNRLLRNVITSGTGKAANLDKQGIEVVGKTGTTTDNKDYTFVGLTHDYVAGIWVGNDNGSEMTVSNNAAKAWHNVMASLLANKPQANFELDASVVKAEFCKSTGMLADSGCTNTETGYYRSNNVPAICNKH